MLKRLISYFFVVSPLLITSFYVPSIFVEPRDFPLITILSLSFLYLIFTTYFYFKNKIFLTVFMNLLLILGLLTSLAFGFYTRFENVEVVSTIFCAFLYLAIFYNFTIVFSRRVLFFSLISLVLIFITFSFFTVSGYLFSFAKYIIYPSVYGGVYFVPFLFLFLAILGSFLSRFEILEFDLLSEGVRLKVSNITIIICLLYTLFLGYQNYINIKSKYFFRESLAAYNQDNLDKANKDIVRSIDLKEDKEKYIHKVNTATRRIEKEIANIENTKEVESVIKILLEEQIQDIKRLQNLYPRDAEVYYLSAKVYKNSMILTGESGYDLALISLTQAEKLGYDNESVQALKKEIENTFDLINGR